LPPTLWSFLINSACIAATEESSVLVDIDDNCKVSEFNSACLIFVLGLICTSEKPRLNAGGVLHSLGYPRLIELHVASMTKLLTRSVYLLCSEARSKILQERL
jgi:hypothetical protein